MVWEGFDPVGHLSADVLLIEARAGDSVRVPVQGLRSFLQIRQDIRSDLVVIVEQVTFGIFLFGPEDLAEMVKSQGMAIDVPDLGFIGWVQQRAADLCFKR